MTYQHKRNQIIRKYLVIFLIGFTLLFVVNILPNFFLKIILLSISIILMSWGFSSGLKELK